MGMQKRVFVMVGPPGTGKGTQADLLREKYGLYHIDTGRALRQEITDGSAIGQEAKSYMDQGLLVPIDVVLQVIKAAMEKIPPDKQGYLFDGFPRNLEQAKGFIEILNTLNLCVDRVFYLDMPHADLMDRLAYRVSCTDCKATFNTKLNPPKPVPGGCQHTNLTQRDDDKPEVIGKRLEQYNQETAPLIDYFDEAGYLTRVDARQSIDAVKAELNGIVDTICRAVSV